MYYNRKSNMPDGRKGVPMKLVIPEYKTLELDTIFLDMNGTIAVDGVIPPSVKERLIALSEQFRIYVLTACRYAWKCESAVRRASGDPGDISDR